MLEMIRRGAVATTVAMGLSAGLLSLPASAQSVPESTDPIKIALFDWTSVNINATILAQILKAQGYNVELVTSDYLSSLQTGLQTGDLTIGMEFWDTTAGEAMAAADASGKTERLGALGPKAKEEWWYPLYMKEKCPGLPNWEALKDPACAEAFSTPETAPKGRYVGGPVTWEGFDDERVEALGLPFEVIHAGTDAAMFAELESAYQRKAPVMLWVYSPHWAPAKYEGEWVEFPEYSKECYEDPSVGVNPDMAYDCGKPFGEIWKYAWAGMKDKWPVAHKIATNYSISADDLNALSGQVDLDGKSIEDAAAGWIEANKDKIASWAQ
ncbi:glycine betaine/proline transport system substrate-binding protein [Dongia mobilis]|uniref:Glycine betaine/proline transport system substrate-binding protein n=1 Tax=Dongia mobilis TaxID=578943 RepID=A0A4R6WMS0_9PROT|nr:ABC transporter substrate-binding protein [Dongia mobilis]TDQ80439.1 glycine betaine/proline transport system substrate-binding protein [Dongia mobilis]